MLETCTYAIASGIECTKKRNREKKGMNRIRSRFCEPTWHEERKSGTRNNYKDLGMSVSTQSIVIPS